MSTPALSDSGQVEVSGSHAGQAIDTLGRDFTGLELNNAPFQTERLLDARPIEVTLDIAGRRQTALGEPSMPFFAWQFENPQVLAWTGRTAEEQRYIGQQLGLVVLDSHQIRTIFFIINSAVSRWVCNASTVTSCPSNVNCSNRARASGISLVLPATARCANTTPNAWLKALNKCNAGCASSPLLRSVLPSTAIPGQSCIP